MNKKSYGSKSRKTAPFLFDLQKELEVQDSLLKIKPTFNQKGEIN